MNAGMIVWLAVQGAVFAFWAVIAFRVLFSLLGQIRQRSGQILPGVTALPDALRLFWRGSDFARDRRRLFWLTLVLLVLSAGFGVMTAG